MIAQEEATQDKTGHEPQEKTMYQHYVRCSFSLQIRTDEGLGIKGNVTMQQSANIPKRASRPAGEPLLTLDECDDKLNTTIPRSAIHWRATETHPQTPSNGNRVSGNTRIGLVVLLVACIAFLVSGIHSPLLDGNIITIHVPLIWLVALLGIGVVVASFLKHR